MPFLLFSLHLDKGTAWPLLEPQLGSPQFTSLPVLINVADHTSEIKLLRRAWVHVWVGPNNLVVGEPLARHWSFYPPRTWPSSPDCTIDTCMRRGNGMSIVGSLIVGGEVGSMVGALIRYA